MNELNVLAATLRKLLLIRPAKKAAILLQESGWLVYAVCLQSNAIFVIHNN